MQRRLTIVRPETQAVSVSGCSLNCIHCQGYFLKGMSSSVDWSKDSFLVSGGCNSEGRVGIDVSLLAELKEKGKKVNVHPGLVDSEMAVEIGRYADVVSFDFVTDDEVIRSIYNLDKTEDDFIDSYRLLKANCKRVVPHVLVGFGNEKRSLDRLHSLGEKEVCFIVLMKHPQVKNDLEEPSVEQIEEVLKYARERFDKIHFGCMRPLGRKKEIDEMAVKYVDSIVNPHKDLEFSDAVVEEKRECCCFWLFSLLNGCYIQSRKRANNMMGVHSNRYDSFQ